MEPPLPLDSLLRELDEMGCTVNVKGGKASVSQPADPAHRERFNRVLMPSLRVHRAAVLSHFGQWAAHTAPEPEQGTKCGECGGLVFTDDPAVQQMCHMLMCPLWKKGVGPDWMAKARNEERYRRGQKK